MVEHPHKQIFQTDPQKPLIGSLSRVVRILHLILLMKFPQGGYSLRISLYLHFALISKGGGGGGVFFFFFFLHVSKLHGVVCFPQHRMS